MKLGKSNKNNKKNSIIIVVLIAIIVLLIVALVVMYVTMSKVDNNEETVEEIGGPVYEMEKKYPTEGFDIEGFEELNEGILEVTGKLKTADLKSIEEFKVSSEAYITYLNITDKDYDFTERIIDPNFEYNEFNRISDRYSFEDGGYVVLDYDKNYELCGILGDAKGLKRFLENEKLGEYFSSFTEMTNMASYDGLANSITYSKLSKNNGYESIDDTFGFSLNGPNENKEYIFVEASNASVEPDDDELYWKLQLINSGIYRYKENIDEDEINKVESKQDDVIEYVGLNNYCKEVVYDIINKEVMSVNYQKMAEFEYDQTGFEVDMSDYHDGVYENTPNGNEELTEEMGFQRNSEGYIVNELPQDYEWSSADGTFKYDSDNNYYADEITYNIGIIRYQQEEVKRRNDRIDEAKARNKVIYISCSEYEMGLQVYFETEEEFNKFCDGLSQYGEVSNKEYIGKTGSLYMKLNN